MNKYLTDEQLINLEKKYFNILFNLISNNLGSVISQIYTQDLIENKNTTEKVNQIDKATENILEGLITEQLHWKVCSLSAAADSCFECGDAIIHVDSKTLKYGDEETKVNVEGNQTSYIEGQRLNVSGKDWLPTLKCYEKHKFYGYIPNLTYICKVYYSEENLVEQIYLISLPNGQLGSIFEFQKILGAGKSIGKDDLRGNIRFLTNKIKETENQDWRVVLIYDKKKDSDLIQ